MCRNGCGPALPEDMKIIVAIRRTRMMRWQEAPMSRSAIAQSDTRLRELPGHSIAVGLVTRKALFNGNGLE
jgi:hypothetical protein